MFEDGCLFYTLANFYREFLLITTRSFKHYNSPAFNNDVALAPWSIVDAFDDVEDKLYYFNSLFNDILDKHAPIKTFKIRGRPNPCVTENIRELMKTRDRWRKRAKETNDPEAWIEYKNLKHKVRSEIRLAERELLIMVIELSGVQFGLKSNA